MSRTDLYVPFEDNDEVRALGAHRDLTRMCWYLETGQDPTQFSKWLDYGEPERDGFMISSDSAFVASAGVECWRCHTDIQVICIFCESGTVSDEPLSRFTISSVSEINDTLQEQLARWPGFRFVPAEGCFVNNCAHCGAVQDEMELHSEPDHPFFNIPDAAPGAVQLIPIGGTVQLNGCESFAI